ncbi:Uncharacterized protein dnl_09960 [Desulfonema limicola]|uniref:Uncharacterized protein n=1 Tax=Desulfonema limicola TaxID=45656 RepID=A0A975GF06_9BACT|nr:Uncharacterized protein dnl_09960 [Desulfonema limicola]
MPKSCGTALKICFVIWSLPPKFKNFIDIFTIFKIVKYIMILYSNQEEKNYAL